MKRNLRCILVILIVITVILPLTYSCAIAKSNEKSFFEISKIEVTKKEKIEMVLNLDIIQYDNFIFELQASEDIENVEILQNNIVETEKNSNEIIMEINKEKTNVNTINLYYSIPQNKKVGDSIKFVAFITNILKNEDNQINENPNTTDNENDQEDNNINTSDKEELIKVDDKITQDKPETQKIEYEVKIIEEKKEEQILNSDDNKEKEEQILNKDDDKNKNQLLNIENNKQEMPDKQDMEKNNISSINQKISAQSIPTSTQYLGMSTNQTVQVTYKGSDNNYLSGLSIKDYELNKEFSKDNTTYFITVENEIEKLDIETIADDSNATTIVYGNENLKEGTNKILISVTAENGNVRNYRIYVTRKA